MFRFSIRELLLLTLVVAIGSGWMVDGRIFHREADDLWNKLDKANRELAAQEFNAASLLAESAQFQAENAKLRRWLLDRDTQRELELHLAKGR